MDLELIGEGITTLYKYLRQECQVFYKILKKWDKNTKSTLGNMTIIRLESEHWWRAAVSCEGIEDLMVGLSDAYVEFRKVSAPVNAENPERGNPNEAAENFVRKTQKYFVTMENIVELQTILVKHVPLDIFNRETNKKSKGKSDTHMDELKNVGNASVITSVYFDNDDLEMYHARTAIESVRGNLVRVRWYGSLANPPSSVFMERKVTRYHGEYNVANSVKERFRIKTNDVPAYCVGDWQMKPKIDAAIERGKIDAKRGQEIINVANDIQKEIENRKLRPALRTVVRRSAFQNGRDASVRFSLDTNLHMLNEVGLQSGKLFCANYANQSFMLKDPVIFPYAILEIKLQIAEPGWVTDLKQSSLIFKGSRFSKFLYGTCKLRPDRVRFVPPKWFERSENFIANPPEQLNTIEPVFGKSLGEKLRNVVASLDRNASESEGASEESKRPRKHNHNRINRQSRKSRIVGAGNERLGLLLDDGNDDDGDDQGPPQPAAYRNIALQRAVSVHGPQLPKKPDMKAGNKEKQRMAKTYFSNERTLLSWINTVTFLSLSGLTLINTNNTIGQYAGIAMIAITIAFSVYAVFRYRRRLAGIGSDNPKNFEDRIGPPVLITLFCLVLAFLGNFFFWIFEISSLFSSLFH